MIVNFVQVPARSTQTSPSPFPEMYKEPLPAAPTFALTSAIIAAVPVATPPVITKVPFAIESPCTFGTNPFDIAIIFFIKLIIFYGESREQVSVGTRSQFPPQKGENIKRVLYLQLKLLLESIV